VFGLSFGELVILVIVGVVVIGPKDLPKVLRKLGRWSGQLRRWAFDLRAQSGIDEVLRVEGIGQDINEIRKLARGELEGVIGSASVATSAPQPYAPPTDVPASTQTPIGPEHVHHGNYSIEVPREREWPRDGADGYGALPDGAAVYDAELPRSAVADQIEAP